MAAASRFRTVVADDAEDMRELIVAALEANGRFEVVAQAADAAGAADRVPERHRHRAEDTRSPSAARRFVTETLNRWDCATALDTVELLVSEVVTNAVLHAESAPDVAVQLLPDTIRVEVTDRDPRLPEPRVVADED